MWTEVSLAALDGMDAVWGEGGVGDDHLEIAHDSWGDSSRRRRRRRWRVIGKIKVEMAEVKSGRIDANDVGWVREE